MNATVPFAARHAPPDRGAELLAAVRQLRAELAVERLDNWRLRLREVRLRRELRAAREALADGGDR
jgi:hypothetical protein